MAKKKNKPARPEAVKQPSKKQLPVKEKRAWMMPALIFLFSVILYYNTMDHGYVMDDGAMITDNATTKMGYKGMKQFFRESSVYGATKENYGTYRPLTMATYAFDLGFFGFKEGQDAHWPIKQQRVIHLMLYGLCCMMLYLVLKRLLKNYHPLIPAVASLIFAAHPLHTEVGAFIKSRDELLSMFFIFSSLYLLLRSFEDKRKRIIGGSIFLFLLAMFSKESAITFVVLFPLALYFFTEKKLRDIVMISLPFIGCGLFYIIVRNAVLEANSGYMPVINNTLVDANGLGGRLPTIFVVLAKYLKLLVYPNPLTWDYGYNQIPLTNWSDMVAISSLVIHLALGAFAIWGLKRKNIFSFCILFYLITVSISANIFVLISAVMAERFLFIPSIAFCIAIAYVLTKFLSPGNSLKPSAGLLAVVGGIVVIFAGCTISRNKDWESNYTLFQSGAEDSPNSYRTNTAYAWECLKAGEAEKDPVKRKEFFINSRSYFEKATSIYPKQYLDWYNLGVVRNYLGDSVGTEQAYIKSYELKPTYVSTCYNLGVVHYRRHDYAGALKYWMDARNLDENFESLNFKVGLVYQYLMDYKNSIIYYEKYYAANPTNYDVINNLSMVYSLSGNTAKANEFAAKAHQMRPKK